MKKHQLTRGISTCIHYQEKKFNLYFQNNEVVIKESEEDYAIVSLKSQHVAYKATLLGGFVMDEKKVGKPSYQSFFTIFWDDELAMPELFFSISPKKITRNYSKGQYIELDVERVPRYNIKYEDNVEACIERSSNRGYEFQFNTGFYGEFWREKGGSYHIVFQGDKLKPGEEVQNSQSKFIVSRSKYTDNIILYVQEDAVVTISDTKCFQEDAVEDYSKLDISNQRSTPAIRV